MSGRLTHLLALAALAAMLPVAVTMAQTEVPRPRPAPISEPATSEPSAELSPATDEASAEAARLPRPRPAMADALPASSTPTPMTGQSERVAVDPVELGEAPNASAAIEELGRVPRPRPEGAPTATLALVQPDAMIEENPLAPAAPPPLTAEESQCLERLATLGVVFTREPSIMDQGACNVPHPLSVSSIGSGVALSPAATLTCSVTESLALWARDVLVPAAEKHLQARPDELVNASAYVCRPRNNQPGAKLSEHARANAFDIAAIGFADHDPVAVESRGSDDSEGRFQMAIREGSCRYFTTVLGPGSNAAHATHFHFDMAERRGGYRLCELGEPMTADREPANTNRE
jgi:hypothetical protein